MVTKISAIVFLIAGLCTVLLAAVSYGWQETGGILADGSGAATSRGANRALEKVEPGRISSLSVIENVLKITYRDVAQIKPEQLLELGNDGLPPILLDVREADEFAVSHIKGAIRIAPGASREEVLDAAGDVDGRSIVVYCSVGARSSTLARKVQQSLKTNGAVSVHNLTGGIFRWHNDGRALVNRSGVTDFVHRFDTYWGQLLERQELAVGSSQEVMSKPGAGI
ncbi:MAG: rhodanese-like domain-containing protein [Alphaproteobacteria bacterium]|nr:rhodanese-like domain-containing protein [Alphaproteobacteria bacterium]